MSNNGLISGSFSSDTTLSTPVAINKGGTGQITAQAALDALAAASGTLVQGDIFIVDASLNVVRLARGADDTALVMNGNNPNWEAAGGGVTTNSITTTSTTSFNTTSTTYVAVTDMEITLSTQAGGMALVSPSGNWENTTANTSCQAAIFDDGAEIESSATAFTGRVLGRYMNALSLSANVTTDGSDMALYVRAIAGTCNLNFGTNAEGQLKAFEVY